VLIALGRVLAREGFEECDAPGQLRQAGSPRPSSRVER
jgi:hypothetical protein